MNDPQSNPEQSFPVTESINIDDSFYDVMEELSDLETETAAQAKRDVETYRKVVEMTNSLDPDIEEEVNANSAELPLTQEQAPTEQPAGTESPQTPEPTSTLTPDVVVEPTLPPPTPSWTTPQPTQV